MLYSSTDAIANTQFTDANSYLPLKVVDSTIVQRIMDELEALGESEEECMSDPYSSSFILTLFQYRVHWSAALLKHCAVSYTASVHYFNALASTHRIDINRITLPSISTTNNPADGLDPAILPDPRILILSVSPDLSTSSIPIMNCIFSAQKLVSRHSYSSLPFISLDM